LQHVCNSEYCACIKLPSSLQPVCKTCEQLLHDKNCSKGKHTLISTWLNVLPLYTPTSEPIISGRITASRKCVRTGSGFSPAGAFFFCKQKCSELEMFSACARAANYLYGYWRTRGVSRETPAYRQAHCAVKKEHTAVRSLLINPTFFLRLFFLRSLRHSVQGQSLAEAGELCRIQHKESNHI
jgi:hypothetical protein